jgi:hypothetical protein
VRQAANLRETGEALGLGPCTGMFAGAAC